jgi:hypothetical protein
LNRRLGACLLAPTQHAATTLLGLVAAFFVIGRAAAQAPDFSLEAQRRLQGGANANSPEVMAQRQRLLTTGQAQLAAGKTDAAQQAFDKAALLLHAADTEVALVRTYMQAGEYRRALAFGAHAAGAHREMPAATALYAWLLHLGGQTQVAQRLLTQASGAAADDATVQWATQQMPAASTVTMAAPTPPLLSPPSFGMPVPAHSAVVGSALLLGDGQQALVPTRLLRDQALWLRNGLGQTVAASLVLKEVLPGVSLLRLQSALALPTAVAGARVPFAGSPGAMVEFMPNEQDQAAWPVMRLGFFARIPTGDAPRALGIEAPAGPRGGPVFDFNGRLVGMAVVDEGGANRMLAVDDLTASAGVAWLPAATTQSADRVGADSIYEVALRMTLQVLVAR